MSLRASLMVPTFEPACSSFLYVYTTSSFRKTKHKITLEQPSAIKSHIYFYEASGHPVLFVEFSFFKQPTTLFINKISAHTRQTLTKHWIKQA